MFRRKPKVPEPYRTLIEELSARDPRYNGGLKDSDVGRKLLEASPEEQRAFVLAAAAWLNHYGPGRFGQRQGRHAPWMVRAAMAELLRRRLPFGHDDVLALLDLSSRLPGHYWRSAPQMVKVVEDHFKEHDLTPALREKIERLAKSIGSEHSTAETRRWVVKLKELAGEGARSVPLEAGEAWSDAALADVAAAEAARANAWIELLHVCRKATGSTPTARWLKSAAPALGAVGVEEFKQAVLKWFPLVDRSRTRRIEPWSEWHPDPNNLLEAANADILRALVWLCAGREDREIARALSSLAVSAYRKVPGVGPRCVRVGNACVWALGQMPGAAGVEELALLKIKVKFGTAQRGIESALAAAAQRAGLPQDEIEEMSVPTYGLEEVGARREQLGEHTAEVVVTGTSAAELRWVKSDGRKQSSVPQAVREQHAEELKELSGAVKDIRRMLPAQAARIESLYVERKKWPLALWRERYLDHPLVGTLARRLIWRFDGGGPARSGIWREGRMVASDGRALDWPDESAEVELWHPIHEATETITAWRRWLAENEVAQPFKQAHREIYLLTDAERETRVYSNRFAAHVVKQHQFNALCGARGWKNKLRLMVDDDYPPAVRPAPAWGLRAEFWVEGAGENYGADTTEAGTYLYLATDQVRFYQSGAAMNYAHAGGGGYYAGSFGRETPAEPLPLEQIPPLVFSEIMRDVDLFVGVASVANDPNWADGGPEGRYRDYWSGYSFGDLSETAKTRREVLAGLIPRLKIADRCRLSDKFLVVRGDVRTYKIHLGSGNILMEPNDQYLCVVPARGAAAGDGLAGKVFLPFEGDNTMAIILSKAMLLAEDWKIKDPTILRQIGK